MALCMAPASFFAQEKKAAGAGLEFLEIAQRQDIRRRVDGKYAGLFYAYTLSRLEFDPLSQSGRASHYITEESLKDMTRTAKSIGLKLECAFEYAMEEGWNIRSGSPGPLRENFPPGLPPEARPGASWEAQGALRIDPLGSGSYSRVKILMSCVYQGLKDYRGKKAHEIKAVYALRYRAGEDPEGDKNLLSAEGSREALIYLDPESGAPLFVREMLKGESYRGPGASHRDEGFILHFYRGSAPQERTRERERERDRLVEELKDEDGVKIRDDVEGTVLVLDKLHFAADSPELLPGQESILERIATSLKRLPPEGKFLVTGHTANIGSQESQLSLSRERALRIVQALVKSGLSAERFLFEGRGGSQAIGDDSTEEGRAQNRRVEILLLD